jgi:arabinan endo-1,5-alpha-L-arabinosidase
LRGLQSHNRRRTILGLSILALLLAGCGTPATPLMKFKTTGEGTPAAMVTPTEVAEQAIAADAALRAAKAEPSAVVTEDAVTGVPEEFLNPVLNQDFPDPDVLKVGEWYYAYATNQIEDGRRVQVARSRNLVEWEFLGEGLAQLPEWSTEEFGYTWAPDVALIGQQYVMYYTTRFVIKEGGVQCIGVATAEKPEGPFTPTEEVGQPLVCQQEQSGSIDAATFLDTDGSLYLLWKSDANSVGGIPWIYIQLLSDDGMQREGEAKRLITVDLPWEGTLVEGPTLWKREGKYFLFYSANDYRSPRYAVGVAVADNILGPYEKNKEPILKTTLPKGIVGPGGQDVVIGPDGDTWMLFHAWTAEGVRNLNLGRLRWVDESPVVELPARAEPGG